VPQPPQEKNPSQGPASLLASCEPLLATFYSQSGATRWGLSQPQFVCGLERSLRKRFQDGAPSPDRLEEYLLTLHVEDLALTTACIEGSESAWEYFVQEYRSYLRAAAGAITKASRYGANPQELADSLFSDLFGLMDGKRGERSLFRYFHGRSSLKTWLRAVLAQRHIDHCIPAFAVRDSADHRGVDIEFFGDCKYTPLNEEETISPGSCFGVICVCS